MGTAVKTGRGMPDLYMQRTDSLEKDPDAGKD